MQRRFFGAKRELSEPLAHRFTQLDGQNDVGLVATTGTRGRIIGVGRYNRTWEQFSGSPQRDES